MQQFAQDLIDLMIAWHALYWRAKSAYQDYWDAIADQVSPLEAGDPVGTLTKADVIAAVTAIENLVNLVEGTATSPAQYHVTINQVRHG